ncbi:MAG: hypothetical protein KKH80_01835, partial [Candidatus Omnitrophica bacterium]|nr:hypothetical protein [Candidatus Omnitrophota bacterium]
MHKIIIALGLILLFSMSLCSAQEEIAITTYYPSPYGVYQELRSQRMAIGENWINSGTYPWDVDGGDPEGNEIRQDADLVVEGNVGIKMKNPLATLHLYGTGAAFGEGSRIYFGDNYNLPSWENVFIEEYGGTDSDALRIHGRMGIYLSSGG